MKAVKQVIRSYFKYISVDWTQPVLTSNTSDAPEMTVSASSEWSDSTKAWVAFDNNTSTRWSVADRVTTGTLYVDFAENMEISSIEVTGWSNPNDATGTVTIYSDRNKTQQIGMHTFNSNASYTYTFSEPVITKELAFYVTSYTGYWACIGEIKINAKKRVITSATPADYDFYTDSVHWHMPEENTVGYYKGQDYTTAGTYTYNITRAGKYRITLIGGGGGSAQVDGGTDPYSDTGWSWHYGHNGANGGVFEGWARLEPGTLTIVVGSVGANRAGKGSAAGNGGDSYAIYTPTGGSPVEIARAYGGHSGYPDGSSFGEEVLGGGTWHNPSYFSSIVKMQNGSNAYLIWSVRI